MDSTLRKSKSWALNTSLLKIPVFDSTYLTQGNFYQAGTNQDGSLPLAYHQECRAWRIRHVAIFVYWATEFISIDLFTTTKSNRANGRTGNH
jgi:hypothetical protein